MLRHIPHRIVSKIAAVALVASQMVLGVPTILSAQSRASRGGPLPAPKVKVNKTVPKVTPPPLTPTFSAVPTTAEIFRARIFTEPIVPVGGTPSGDENTALAQALTAFHRDGRASWKANLAVFLADYPSSPWRPSVLAGLGEVQLQGHQYGQALRSWDEAWMLAKDDPSPKARAVADHSVAQWLTLAGDMGQLVAFDDRLRELEGRNMSGTAGIKVARARESSFLIRMHPDRITLCGPAALQALMLALKPGAAMPKVLTEFKGSLEGTTLTEMQTLARQAGAKVQMVRRTTATEVPVPSIVHWSVGHYATVLEHRDGRYRIIDKSRGNEFWITAETLFDESSGYFLIPENVATTGWEHVTGAQGEQVRGLGPLCPDGAQPPADCPDCNDQKKKMPGPKPNKGMPTFEFHALSTSLLLRDEPVGYEPPRGPAVPFEISYHQREWTQPGTFTFSNLGPKWSLNWVRYVKEEPTDALGVTPVHTWVSMPPGGREVFNGNPCTGGVGGPGSLHWRSFGKLACVSVDPIRYEHRLLDGTVEVFGLSDGAATGSRRVFLTQIIDPQGQSLAFTWDEDFRLVAVTDALGQVSTIQYDLAADPLKITSITDPFGREAVFTYNALGQLESITDVMGMTSRLVYGGDDFITTLTTPYGTTSFRYEPSALNSMFNTRFIEATDPLGGTRHMEFQFQTPSLAATESASVVPTGFGSRNIDLDHFNTFYWDERAWREGPGDLSKAILAHWESHAEFDGWQEYSSLTHSIKMPLENRIWFILPRPVSNTGCSGCIVDQHMTFTQARVLDDGASQVWYARLDPDGLVVDQRDPLQRQTSYTYDTNRVDPLTARQTTGGTLNETIGTLASYVQHRPQSVTDAAGQTTTLAYNSAGQLLTLTNALNEVTTYGYDSDGYLTSITGAVSGAITSLSYDGYGRVRTITGSDDYAVTIDYDLLDRPVRVTLPDSTYEETTYNRLDVVTSRDRRGRVTSYYHDALGRTTAIRDPLGRTTTQIWCACGSLDALVDAKGNRTNWTRDVQGRITSEVRANASSITYEYEATTSRLKKRTDALGQAANYEYFLDDKLKQVTYTNAIVSTPAVAVTYDTNYGRVATMTDGIGTTTYSYYAVGGLGALRVSSVDGPRSNDTISYAYDQIGRLATRTLGSAATTLEYDALGRLEAVTDPIGTFGFAYDGQTPRLAQLTYPNEQLTSYSYFGNAGDRRLQEIHHQTAAAVTLSKFTYAYDIAGNITTWTQQYESTTRAYDFGYEETDQLASAVYRTIGGSPTILKRYGYSYDSAGNRTNQQVDDAPTAWTYDAMNRLTAQAGTAQLKFEGILNEAAMVTIGGQPARVNASNQFVGSASVANGANTVAVTATDASGNTRTQEYEVEVANAGGTLSYDANGNLAGRGTRTYSWDAENRLVQVADNGTPIASFTYDGWSRRSSKMVGSTTHDFVYDGINILEDRIVSGTTTRYVHGPAVDRPLASVDSSGNPTYYLSDHLGSIVQATDASGAVTLTRQYDPYGVLLQGETVSGYAFTGREWDEEIGLYYFRARYYDPAIGRFISADPVGFSAGPNLYAYVDGRPLSLTDPEGLQGKGGGPGPAGQGGYPGAGKASGPGAKGNPDTKSITPCELCRQAGPLPDFFLFGSLGASTATPLRFAGEGVALAGHASDGGWYLGVIGALGFELGSHDNYGAAYVGLESTTLHARPTWITLREIALGPEIPFLAGCGIGVGRFDTKDESGLYYFIEGGFIGQKGALGVGFPGPKNNVW
jgi:RHS repeat-associated protein